jgi:hypothetical protein
VYTLGIDFASSIFFTKGLIVQSKKTDLYQQIKKIVQAARSGEYGQASSDINIFLQLLQIEVSKGYIRSDELSKVTYSLETLMEMQKKGDWVALADILEYELADIINTWQ